MAKNEETPSPTEEGFYLTKASFGLRRLAYVSDGPEGLQALFVGESEPTNVRHVAWLRGRDGQPVKLLG